MEAYGISREKLQKLGSAGLLALAVLGFLGCLALLVGVWMGKGWIDRTATQGITTLDQAIEIIDWGVLQLDTGLNEVQTRLETIAQTTANLADGAARDRAMAAIRNLLSDNLLQRIQRFRELASSIQREVDTFSQTLDSFAWLPVPGIQELNNKVQAINTRLSEIELSAGVLSRDAEQSNFTDLNATVERLVGQIRDLRSQISSIHADVQQIKANLKATLSAVPRWTTTAAILITLLAILCAVGQLSLAERAWGWWQRF